MKYHITKSELEILGVLWKADRPLSRADILELSSDKTWKDNSIHILLNGMLKKRVIKETGFARSGKVWGRLYAPAVTVEEYYVDQFQSTAQPDLVLLFDAVLKLKADKETLEKLQAMLDEAKAKLAE